MSDTSTGVPSVPQKRLIDLVFSARVIQKLSTGELVPEVYYCFPNVGDDRSMQVRQLLPFCFPDLECMLPQTNMKPQQFSFVLTTDGGERRFGYVLRSLTPGDPADARYPQCFCIISFFACFDLYMQVLHVVEQYSTLHPSLVFSFLQAVYDAPSPLPGEKMLPITAKSPTGEERSYCFKRPADSDYLIENVALKPLFQHASPDDILHLFASLLHERPIIFTAKEVVPVSSAAQAAVALLYPFTWQYVFIPVLPGSALMMACAPIPFVLGILKTHIADVRDMQKHGMVEADVIVYDLDAKTFVSNPHATDLDTLPSEPLRKLHTTIEQLCTRAAVDDSVNGSTPEEPFNQAAAEAFLTFFTCILRGIRQHFRTTGALSSNRAVVQFDQSGYLLRLDQTDPPLAAFYRSWFVHTQLFSVFVSEREEHWDRYRGPFDQAAARIDAYPDPAEPSKPGPKPSEYSQRVASKRGKPRIGLGHRRRSMAVATSNYDVVIGIENMADFLTRGWTVDAVSSLEREKWNGHIIGVMGLFNKGKTFCLNRLCNMRFRSGDTERDKTVGLSIKFMKTPDSRSHVILDSAGLHRPIEMKSSNQAGKISDALFTMEVTQEFLNHMILRLSDYIILMVDHLNILDQKLLHQLIRQRAEQPSCTFREIFVVHNIRTLESQEDFEALWRGICGLYDGVEVVQTVRLPDDPRDYDVRFFQSHGARHVLIGNDFSKFGQSHNQLVFELVRRWIQIIVPRRPRPADARQGPLGPIIEAMNELLPGYFEGFKEVVFDAKHMVLCHADHHATFKFEKLRALGMASALGSELLAAGAEWYRQFTPCKRVVTTSKHFVVELEVPGLTKEDLKITPARSQLPDHWGVDIEGIKYRAAGYGMFAGDSDTTSGPETVLFNSEQHGRFVVHLDIPSTFEKVKPEIFEKHGIVQLRWPKAYW